MEMAKLWWGLDKVLYFMSTIKNNNYNIFYIYD